MSTNFQGFGNFAQAVRMRKFDAKSNRAASAFGSTTIASDGGYAVPIDFANDIFMRGENSLVPLCQIIPSASNSIAVPVDEATPWASTGILASWDDEGSEGAPRKPLQTFIGRLSPGGITVKQQNDLFEICRQQMFLSFGKR